MNDKGVIDVWEEVARMNGITPEEVVSSIDNATHETLRGLTESNDAEKLELWRSIPCKGGVPTAEELLLHLADEILADVIVNGCLGVNISEGRL